jgi:kynureninase
VVEREWGQSLIRSWNEHGWIDAPARIGARIAPLIGAQPHEVIVADSVTVNIFKLLTAAAALAPERRVILSEAGNFHTDLHVASGAADLLGMELRVVERGALDAAIGPDVALLLLTHVHYKAGYRFDMGALTARAKAAGARIIWDLSHSVGAVPLYLNGDGAELAIGCGYKYLNGGPGAPAFLYVAEALQEQLRPALCGWMGHAAPFAFTDHYEPAPGIARFLVGTPPMLSLLALESGVETFAGANMEAVWAKSVALFDLFARLAEERCPELDCISPAAAANCGAATSHSATLMPSSSARRYRPRVIGDFRRPDVIRFGLTPLYLGYEDVWRAVEIMAAIWRRKAGGIRASRSG